MAVKLFFAALITLALGDLYLKEQFLSTAGHGWVESKASKDGVDSDIAKYDGVWKVEGTNNSYSLVATAANRHYGISKGFKKPFKFTDGKPFVLQYEVQFQQQMTCGGSYVKLLSDSANLDLTQLADKTPYTILFGPDKCGAESHLRFIYRFLNPTTNTYREVHAKRVMDAYSLLFSDRRTHLLTLVVSPDNTFVMKVDGKEAAKGDLASAADFEPALEPPRTVADSEDVKPSDWVDDAEMDDPEDVKPDDWDESQPAFVDDMTVEMPAEWDESAPRFVPDPQATQPEDWDVSEDGEWEAPTVENPKCDTGCGEWVRPTVRNPLFKGKWHPRRIDNPAFKGVWAPRQIPNPDFFEETAPFAKLDPISAIGLELWTTVAGITFSNIFVSDDVAAAQAFAEETWVPKKAAEDAADPTSGGFLNSIKDWTAELQAAAQDQPYLYVLFTALVGLPIIVLVRCFAGEAPAPLPPARDAPVRRDAAEAPVAAAPEAREEAAAEGVADGAGGAGGAGAGADVEEDAARDVPGAAAAVEARVEAEAGAAAAGEAAPAAEAVRAVEAAVKDVDTAVQAAEAALAEHAEPAKADKKKKKSVAAKTVVEAAVVNDAPALHTRSSKGKAAAAAAAVSAPAPEAPATVPAPAPAPAAAAAPEPAAEPAPASSAAVAAAVVEAAAEVDNGPAPAASTPSRKPITRSGGRLKAST